MRDRWNDAVIAEFADLMVYQSIRKPLNDSAKVLAGVEYVMIDPRYAELTPNFDGPIVVSLGGSDPHGLTPKVVAALRGIEREVIVINGAAASELDEVDGVQVVHAPESLVAHLDGAALLIGALGMTSYEAAASGVPSLLYSWSEDHERTAQELEARGVCVNLGRYDKFDGAELKLRVGEYLEDRAQWKRVSNTGKSLVDGHGVERVAEAIVRLLE